MKKAEKEKMEKMEKLLETIDAHPLTAKIRQDKAAEVLAMRQEAALQIEMLRNEEADIIPRLQEVDKEKEAEYLKAKTALQAASDEFQKAHAALSSEANQFSREIGRQEQVLIETADPLIDEAITFFREKLDWLRKPGRINRIGRADAKNIFIWKKTTTEESNVQAVNDAMRYCMDAIRELDRMKLSPELDRARIEGMKAGIPRIDVFTEFTGEKPMEKDPPLIVPRFGGAADDDYEQTLLDRFHKKINAALWKKPEAKPVVQKPEKPAIPRPGGRR